MNRFRQLLKRLPRSRRWTVALLLALLVLGTTVHFYYGSAPRGAFLDTYKPTPHDTVQKVANRGTSTNAFYLMGFAEGLQHRKEGGFIVVPTNPPIFWDNESLELYSAGYHAAVQSK